MKLEFLEKNFIKEKNFNKIFKHIFYEKKEFQCVESLGDRVLASPFKCNLSKISNAMKMNLQIFSFDIYYYFSKIARQLKWIYLLKKKI